jgi:hypothetical protein
MELHEKADGESSKQDATEPTVPQEALAICDATATVQVSSTYPPSVGKDHVTDPKDPEEQGANGKKQVAVEYPLEPLDWNDFEIRYYNAIASTNEMEAALHKEFEELMSVGLLIACPVVSY